ncbi:MAG: AAA family ATPase [Acidobacteria bacterium]|nr:AAA family ATPase [Acidobacteriota bacterium]
MITLIEALHFRCLQDIQRPLSPFQVLVGPNATGKTTFLDVIAFLAQLVLQGLDAAVSERTQNFQHLIFGRSGKKFELAIEAKIPEDRREKLANKEFGIVRYEVSVGLEAKSEEASILAERVLLKATSTCSRKVQRELFPFSPMPRKSIISPKTAKGTKTIVNKVMDGNDNFYDETGKGWDHSFKLGPRKSALGNLPEDESKFPVSTWLKRLLLEGVQQFVLNSLLIRKASPPGQIRGFKPDGSNLPWVIKGLQKKSPDRFRDWIAHLRTALPDIDNIRTIERPDDKHRYLVICYRGGLQIPSWVASDGTLRLLALTLPAYLPDFQGVYLVEEPENGIHLTAVQTMFQSLSSVYNAQMLMATHSPVILSLAEPNSVLCFAKTKDGATDIVSGNEHPALKAWKGETSLGVLFAAGVLG